MKRRTLIQSILVFLLMGFGLRPKESQAAVRYPKTPRDGEGPYYPIQRRNDEDFDLVHVDGQSGIAKGHVLNLRGIVIDETGVPQNEAIVEIWQADSRGRYNHPRDFKTGRRDPNFQYWGKSTVQADGVYFFKTVIPSAYSGRPAHIHYKVWIKGETRLTSQIYFKNHPQNEDSGFHAEQAPLQVIELKPAKNNEFEGFFQIVL